MFSVCLWNEIDTDMYISTVSLNVKLLTLQLWKIITKCKALSFSVIFSTHFSPVEFIYSLNDQLHVDFSEFVVILSSIQNGWFARFPNWMLLPVRRQCQWTWSWSTLVDCLLVVMFVSASISMSLSLLFDSLVGSSAPAFYLYITLSFLTQLRWSLSDKMCFRTGLLMKFGSCIPFVII